MRATEPDATTAFARTLVDEWVRGGVTDACIAPGSRSAPVALALAADSRVRIHVHLDERSAAFFALGLGRVTGRPAVVLCTSGTAGAGFHAAVLEAHHGHVPLLVVTADRPPELRDTGAGQTIEQANLYGTALRWSFDPGPPEARPGAGETWRSIAARSVAATLGPPAGPVHLNLPFREPLVPTGGPLVEAPGRDAGRPWHDVRPGTVRADAATLDAIALECGRAARGLVVAGHGAGADPDVVARFAQTLGWPVLADPVSGLRCGPNAVAAYEALLRVPDFAVFARPDLVLRVGAAPTSKILTAFLDPDVRQIVIDPDAAWLDPQRAAAVVVRADPTSFLDALATKLQRVSADRVGTLWLDRWIAADVAVRAAVDELIATWADPFEGGVARDLAAALPDGATLAVASSMPVRDLEWFMRPRAGLRVIANRGTNGIDGFVSTVLGVAAGSRQTPVVGLLGDLALLHDSNGLLGATRRGIDAVLVVVDNDGGGIFSFLPQAELPEHFELLFGTPHGIDITALAAVHGIPCVRAERADAVVPGVMDAIAGGGVRMVVVPTDRAVNVARHRAVWDAAAATLRARRAQNATRDGQPVPEG